MGDMERLLILMLALLLTVLIVQGQPSFSIEPATWFTGDTLTVTCNLTGITTVGVTIFKGTDPIYTCPFTNSPCSDRDGLSDYSDVNWPQAKTAVLTISNASSTRDDGVWTCSGDDTTTQKSNEISLSITARTKAVLSVRNVVEGGTATFACTSPIITNTTSLEIKKDGMLIYTCGNIVFTCSAVHDIDYSDVTFTGIGTTSGKGTFTVDNADQARDGGSWLCRYGSSLESDPVIFVVNETNDEDLYWLFLLLLILCVGLVIVIVIVSRYKTLVINKLHLEVTKNTVHLSWEPKFEHVPPNTYAKCAQNSLMTYAKFTNRSVVIEFEDLTPDRKHDVTIYCQNQANMKLYKSEEFVVFTLKDSSNTIPKESKTVSLH